MAPDTGASGPRSPIAVLDACVLYPASIRSLLLYAADERTFLPVWSTRILAEAGGALERDHRVTAPAWRRLSQQMDAAFPGARVPGAQVRSLEPRMTNDVKDRHVLAAAVASGASLVITTNLKDFRPADLQGVGVRAMHPDAFLTQTLQRSPAALQRVLDSHLQGIPGVRWTSGQLLGQLKGLGRGNGLAPQFAAAAEARFGITAVAPPPARVRSVTAGRSLGRDQSRADRGRGR